jgi:hypothetical protein
MLIAYRVSVSAAIHDVVTNQDCGLETLSSGPLVSVGGSSGTNDEDFWRPFATRINARLATANARGARGRTNIETSHPVGSKSLRSA